jgi:hypothetical protein
MVQVFVNYRIFSGTFAASESFHDTGSALGFKRGMQDEGEIVLSERFPNYPVSDSFYWIVSCKSSLSAT